MSRAKKAVTKKPAVVMMRTTKPTDGDVTPENSVIVVDTKGVAEVVIPEAPEPVPDHVLVERAASDPSTGQAELAVMAARIAALEMENKKLAALPQPAAQGQIVTRKNEGEDIVQRTSGGNTRVTHDPSPQLREEMATQEVKAV